METVLYVVASLCSIFVVALFAWINHCIKKTFEQRLYIRTQINMQAVQNILTASKTSSNAQSVLELWDHWIDVDYKQHMFSLILFQNPYLLYHKKIKELLLVSEK